MADPGNHDPDGLRLRTLRGDDVSGVLRLLRNGWFKRSIWQWQFSNVNGTGVGGSPVVAERRGEIIGFNGLMPVRVKTELGVQAAGWSCDFIVHDKLRRSGLGRDLKRELDRQCPLILAKGTSPAAARVLPRCGWHEGIGPTQHVIHLRFDEWRGYACAVLRLLRRRSARRPARLPEGTYEFSWDTHLPSDGELDALWARTGSGYRRAIVRDADYMRWRYALVPGVDYTFLHVHRDDHLCAVFVMRQEGDAIRFVDYVGPAKALDLKSAAIAETLRRFAPVRQLSITTTDTEFSEILQSLGSLPTRSGPAGFFVRDVEGSLDDPSADWFLMDGDSDGEFLAAARANGPTVELITMPESEFVRCADQWERLRQLGDRDPLFMSWDWQSEWWRSFGTAHGLSATFAKARASDGTTVAIIPMISWNAQARQLLPTRRLQLIGHLFQGPAAMRTEYLDLLIHPDWEQPVIDAMVRWLQGNRNWDEFILQDAPRSSPAVSDLVSRMADKCYLRELSEPGLDETRYVRADRTFDDYLATLSTSMRRSLFHGRKKLAAKGRVTLGEVDKESIDGGLDLLNELHAKRWGQPVFTDERLEFHRTVARTAAGKGQLRLSVLEIDSRPVSILYDLIAGRRRYNLQQGFDPEVLGSKGSLGIIHFGYVVEACCADAGIDHYDLLAGAGQHELYKRRMGTEAVPLESVQLIRGWPRELVYRLHDWIR